MNSYSRRKFVSSLMCSSLAILSSSQSGAASEVGRAGGRARQLRQQAAPRLAAMLSRLLSNSPETWRYPQRLAIEEALRDPHGGVSGSAISVLLQQVGRLASGSFNALCVQLYLATGEDLWREVFVEQTLNARSSAVLSPEGAWMHGRGRFGDGHAVLIDSSQEEASATAKLAWLVRRGEVAGDKFPPSRWEAEAVRQFAIHRTILRDPQTGLWSNGRGWMEGRPDQLSPGFWSRGHGWLLRGMMETYMHLPTGGPRTELAQLVQETAEAVCAVRGEDGMWRAIMNAGVTESPPESSGSAMITASLLRAVQFGLLPAARYEPLLFETAEVLLREYLTTGGDVLSACPGPGPLFSTENYLFPAMFPPNDYHGIAGFCMLGAALATHGL